MFNDSFHNQISNMIDVEIFEGQLSSGQTLDLFGSRWDESFSHIKPLSQ